MNSSIMRVIAWVVTVVGVIGSFLTGATIGDYPAFENLMVPVIISGLVGTALFAVILFAIAKILENTEYTAEKISLMEKEMKRSTSHAPEGASNSKLNLSELASKNVGNEWRCPKCGKMNPISQRVCKDCAYQK